MADIFGTPVEQIIFQGTQLLQGSIRARQQLEFQREQFAQNIKEHNDNLKLKYENLELEKAKLELDAAAAAAKVAAGAGLKPLTPAEEEARLKGFEREAREFLAPTFRSQGWQIFGTNMQEIQSQISIANSDLLRVDALRDKLDEDVYQKKIQETVTRRSQHEQALELMRQDVDRRINESAYRGALEGGSPQVREVAPRGAPAPILTAPDLSHNEATIRTALQKQRGAGIVTNLTPDLRKQIVEHARALVKTRQSLQLGAFLRGLQDEKINPVELNKIVTEEINFTELR